jgi:hypothetical protein
MIEIKFENRKMAMDVADYLARGQLHTMIGFVNVGRALKIFIFLN